MRENDKYLDSISGHIQQMNAAYEVFSSQVLSSGTVKFFIDMATVLLKVVTGLDRMKVLLGSVLGATTWAYSTKILKSLSDMRGSVDSIIDKVLRINDGDELTEELVSGIRNLNKYQKTYLAE